MGCHSSYIDRELSWMEFNQRVLEEARTQGTPVMERLKFLAITASNLDEFTMVRVGSLCRLIGGEADESDDDARAPARRLRLVLQRMQAFVRDQHLCLAALERDLARHGVRRLRFDQLAPEQVRHVADVLVAETVHVGAASQYHRFPLRREQCRPTGGMQSRLAFDNCAGKRGSRPESLRRHASFRRTLRNGPGWRPCLRENN